MQGSTPRTRNTPPASADRNLAGTVSRFFASSECSKVPWKAKAHVSDGAKVQSIRGGGVGGAPPPRSGFAHGTYPTVSHSATQISSFVPQDLNEVMKRTANRRLCRGFSVGRHSAWLAPIPHGALQSRGLHADLRGFEVVRQTPWGRVGDSRQAVGRPADDAQRSRSLRRVFVGAAVERELGLDLERDVFS